MSAETPIAVAKHQTLSEQCDRDNNRISRLLKRHEVRTLPIFVLSLALIHNPSRF
jgi:hypothetical protein